MRSAKDLFLEAKKKMVHQKQEQFPTVEHPPNGTERCASNKPKAATTYRVMKIMWKLYRTNKTVRLAINYKRKYNQKKCIYYFMSCEFSCCEFRCVLLLAIFFRTLLWFILCCREIFGRSFFFSRSLCCAFSLFKRGARVKVNWWHAHTRKMIAFARARFQLYRHKREMSIKIKWNHPTNEIHWIIVIIFVSFDMKSMTPVSK